MPRGPLFGRAGEILACLFPEAPERTRSRGRPAVVVAAYLLAVAVGAAVLLSRQSGHPAWDTLWAEDSWLYLPAAVLHPWSSILAPYAGYLQLVPRLIADVAASLPFADAAICFAVTGALVASGCALLVFHASQGHVRYADLRAVLAASVLLLPTALIEITNSGVNTPWYLLFAVFWVLLWRPRSRAGMAVAALVCLAAMSSQILVALYAPLALARLVALPRLREQAATLGLAAGGILQVPAVLHSQQPATLGHLAGSANYYLQHVILASVAGWHLATGLKIQLGSLGAVVLAGCAVVMLAAWAFLRGGPRVRIFVVTALGYGLLLCFLPTLVRAWVVSPDAVTSVWLPGSRYTTAPILLIDSVAVVAVDAYLRRVRARGWDQRRVLAVLLLLAVLGTGWVSDFRYPNLRAHSPSWPRVVAAAQATCHSRPRGTIRLPMLHSRLPCTAVNR